ncbi:MAG: DUF368 domain-containing protein [Peptoanaerobacter stomatis]|uniref:DUF368 domain-containing protein n=1 Tax=Peptoanaerobacter stomatis TaxID=796937 RepID=UPI003FA09FB4
MIINIFYGFCMALADSVPGVSGGTIAFILGFYEKLLDSVHYLFSKEDPKKRSQAIYFIVKLIIGWIIGMGMSVAVLSNLFESKIYLLSSIFLGLTLSSIPFVIISEKKNIQGKYGEILFSILGIALVITISSLRSSVLNNSSIHFESLSASQFIYVFISGMIAITAMVLPGISGSTLLLIFGVYVPTITAVKEFITFNFSVIWGLMALGLGILFGLAISIKTIRLTLKNHKSKMIYFITGLMIGSLYAISMGPTTLKNPLPQLSFSTFNIFGFILGIAILLALEFIRRYLEKKSYNQK